MERAFTRKALQDAEPLTKGRDKFGDVWVKVEDDFWLSSQLELKPTSFLYTRRVVPVR